MGTGPIRLVDRPDIPKHKRLAEWLRARIADGTYPPRTQIPPELKLAEETGFARDTVRKATRVLVDDGLLYIVRGLGVFVSGEPSDT